MNTVLLLLVLAVVSQSPRTPNTKQGEGVSRPPDKVMTAKVTKEKE